MGNPFSHLDDKKLMELYRKDEALAFEVLYERHQAKVYTYLHKRLPHSDSVNDVFQNVFTKFHKARHKFDPKYEVLQWIYTITKNELLDYLKKKKINTIQIQEELLSTETQEHEQIDISLENAALSTKEKEAIRLRYFSQKDFDEISHLLETNNTNVRKIISRGIAKLRKKYQQGDSYE